MSYRLEAPPPDENAPIGVRVAYLKRQGDPRPPREIAKALASVAHQRRAQALQQEREHP